ncbi:hypothetical protein BFW38_04665 [Terasakiispira papahanaumokuakeensis]|uniref:NAD(+) diphosphatase n=1 Tax=Terasakiispira papahanaumokuakeensis TaxID=197479 RepID=A0A1E2V7J6_9GAMM|nr:NAD(+) diphosphatase [Terasakiispira papahanaumokuakeensis]ODC02944.1 hypothetical protein BFW38_04665 [Terasakiispira papahanaumokuakeensis]
MWHPLQGTFPQQQVSSIFERGPAMVSPGEPAYWLYLADGRLKPSPRDTVFHIGQVPHHPNADQIMLGRWQGTPVWLQLCGPGSETPRGEPQVDASSADTLPVDPQHLDEAWPTLRQWILAADEDLFDLLATANGLAAWRLENRFCGHCGHQGMQALSHEYVLECPHCRHHRYPRIAPSIITLVWRDNEVLLGRGHRFTPGRYSTLAGFIEAGESAEQAVHREVGEEVGVAVHNLRYLASQSWPFPYSLMLGYWSEYLSGDIVLQEEEIEDARWFSLDNLPDLPPKAAISRYLIDQFLIWKGIDPQ